MKNIYLSNPVLDNIYDEPSDDQLKKIEEELDKYSD